MTLPTLGPASESRTTGPTSAISRDTLIDGSFLAFIRAMMPQLAPGTVVHSDEQLARAQASFLGQKPERKDLWIFGYGSLMWNPAIEYVERRAGTLQGWSRRLNLWMIGGRGTRDQPALTLGLEQGGVTQGVALRLPPGREDFELSLVWQREAFTSAYLPVWVDVETDAGVVEAVTFVSNPDHENYAGGLSDQEVARVVASASGRLGTNVEYLAQTISSMQEIGLQDANLLKLGNCSRLLAGLLRVGANGMVDGGLAA